MALERNKFGISNNGCQACESIINVINDLTMLGNILDEMIERSIKASNIQAVELPGEIKTAFFKTIRIDIDAIPCSCRENLDKGDIPEGRKTITNVASHCTCLQMTLKKEILNDLKKEVKGKIQTVYNLNKELKKKKELDMIENEVKKEKYYDLEDQVVPLPYDILKKKLHILHFNNIKEKKTFMRKLLKKIVPRDLLYCDEDTFREEIGRHRLLPKQINRNYILERAFKNRQSLEEELFESFVLATKGKTPCANILPAQRPRKISLHRSRVEHVTSPYKDDSAEKINIYTFPDHIPDPATAECECQRVTYKIARLEHIKELLYSVLESANQAEQMTLMNCANALLKILTHEQMDENKTKHHRKTSEPQADSDSEPEEHEEEVRLKRSPSFERFRRKLLHDMHIERRPLSWFEKRRLYFRNQNSRRISRPKISINLELNQEDNRKKKIQNSLNEAIAELLELNHSDPYSRLQNADEYILKKLTSIVKTFMKAESNEGDKVKEIQKDESSGWPFGKTLKRKNKWYEHLQEAKACGDLIEKVFNRKKKEISDTLKEDVCSCRGLQAKLLDHAQVVRDVQALFLDALIFWDTSEDSFKKEKDDDPIGGSDESKESYFKTVDLKKLKINFKLHVERGEAIESYNNNFENTWQKSIINGLFVFNREIQVTEKERIIIRQQKEKGVKIMSGGRVGLEPLYSEYVAKGMLDCVVLGDKYSGPSVRNILQAMIEISTDDGILIIIMNEHEYRLNFMIAMQQAKELGITTDLVLAKDDASNVKYDQRETGRWGSTGIILQFKVAGAMAEDGYDLMTISRVCQFMFISSISCYIDEHHIYIGTNFEPGSGKGFMREKQEGLKSSQQQVTPVSSSDRSGVGTSSTEHESTSKSPSRKKSKNKLEKVVGEYVLKDKNIPLEAATFVGELSLDILGRVPKLIKGTINQYPVSQCSESIPETASEQENSVEINEVRLLAVVKKMLNSLLDDGSPHYIALEPGSDVILLLNNQNFTYDQMYAVVKEIAVNLKEIDVTLGRVYIGNFIALLKDGFSITIAKDLEKNLTPFLDKYTTCCHWPPHTSGATFCTQGLSRKIPKLHLGARIHPDYILVTNKVYKRLVLELKKFWKTIHCKEPKLGSQIDNFIQTIPPKYIFKKIPMDRPFISLVDLAKDLEALDGFGLPLSLFLTCAAQEFNVNPEICVNWRMWCDAFYKGACSLAGYLKYEQGSGCVLDVLLPLAKACFDTKPGWNPLIFLKNALDQLDGADWLNKEDPGIMFCTVVAKSVHEVLDDCFGKLDWTTWEEKDDKVYVVMSTDETKKKYRFATEKIQPEVKEVLNELP